MALICNREVAPEPEPEAVVPMTSPEQSSKGNLFNKRLVSTVIKRVVPAKWCARCAREIKDFFTGLITKAIIKAIIRAIVSNGKNITLAGCPCQSRGGKSGKYCGCKETVNCPKQENMVVLEGATVWSDESLKELSFALSIYGET